MARQRLICFPWAGGGPSAFRDWGRALRPDTEVWGVCLPAHEGRIAEPPSTNLLDAADKVATALRAMMSLPLVLFGHSLGSWLAFEVARRMELSGTPVRHLVVSGRRAPSVQADTERIGDLPDAILLETIRTVYGGIPDDVWSQPEILETLLPALRGDLRMLESYRYRPGPKLVCPITVMGGDSDPHTSATGWLEAWQVETDGPFQILRLPGGHFFVESASAEVLQNLEAVLSQKLDRSPSLFPGRARSAPGS
jgi:surfactin synthase thioesterase subunit